MRAHWLLPCLFAFLLSTTGVAAEPVFPLQAKRILILGDSITYGGHYVTMLEAQIRLARLENTPEIINLSLSSETASGLSEPTHPFPRPTVHERLDRALAKIDPDVVVACYGMNDGIYAPFSEKNFAAYRTGIELLAKKVHDSGAQLILMSPPPFDAVPLRDSGKLVSANADVFGYTGMYDLYDEKVIGPYAAWIMQQEDLAVMRIDLHRAVSAYLAEKRKTNPEFKLANDGVHLNQEGHDVIADAIMAAWNLQKVEKPDPELLKLVSERQNMMKQAWLSEVGHKRPGVAAGLPIQEAYMKAAELDKKIEARLKSPGL